MRPAKATDTATIFAHPWFPRTDCGCCCLRHTTHIRLAGPPRRRRPATGTVGAVAKAPAIEVQVGERTVRISNPDRVYFPATGATKLDLVEYYLAVGPGIVNALRERPCMLHRFPTGVSGEKVHQKRVPAGAPPWLETVRVHFPRYGLHADELCVTELAEVIWAVQMSTVEFHPWNSRRRRRREARRVAHRPRPDARLPAGRPCGGSPTSPTRCSTSWARSAGRRRRAAGGCTSTSASSRRYGFTDVRRAALAFAREVERRAPDVVTTTWWRKDRDPGRAVRRLQPERPRPHDGGGVLGAGRARGDGVDADHVGRDRRPSSRATARWPPCPARFAELGDLHAGIDDAVFAIDELLEWAARDERAGAVDAGVPDEEE